MKKIFFACSVLLIISSCKKSVDSPAQQPANQKITKIEYQEPNYSSMRTIAYDDKGRISVFAFNNEMDEFTYPSSNSMVVKRKDKTTGELKSTFEAVLNNAGAVTSMKMILPDGKVSEILTFTYSSEGYMTKMKDEYPLNGNVYDREYSWSNGNVVSGKYWYKGAHVYNYEVQYDVTKLSSVPETPFYRWPSYTLFGKTVRNPYTENKLFNANGTLSSHYKFVQQYDALGSIVKITENDQINNASGTYSYSY